MRFFGAIAAALMLAVGFGTGARAQVTIDVAKITCDQLILFKVADPDYIALWLSGYYHAKQNNTVIDTQELRDAKDKIKTYCRLNPQTTVMQAVETTLGLKK